MSESVFELEDEIFKAISLVSETLNSVACNHMAAIYYFTSSINAHPTAYGYPCAAYTGFDNGQCTVCNANIAMCQKLGYHASAKQVLGKLYSSTLNGVNTPNFGKERPGSTWRKQIFRPRRSDWNKNHFSH